MSQEKELSDKAESDGGQRENRREQGCTGEHKSRGNRGNSHLRSAAGSAEVHQGEPGDGCGGRSTDKQNDKQNDKRAVADSDLSKVIKV